MRRPHIIYSRSPSAGALGLRRRSAGAAHERVCAFLARATDCQGSRSISIEPAPQASELVPVPGGVWDQDGRGASWTAPGRASADDQPAVFAHDVLAGMIARASAVEAPFRATVSYQFLLRHPVSGEPFPYADDDFLEPSLVWSDLLLFLEDRGGNSLYLGLVFPWDQINADIAAVYDAMVDTMGLSPAPSDWKLRTPARQPGGQPRTRKLGFNRAGFIGPVAHDDERLLAAIAAEPDADEPRNVYADLLLERGDPRGEVINVQCELDRLVRACDRTPRRRELETAEARLLRRHSKATWRQVPGARHVRMRRGFVEQVVFESVGKLRAVADSVVAAAPMWSDVAFHFQVGLNEMTWLVHWPGFSRMRGLAVLPFRPTVLPLLVSSPAAGSLRRLATAFVDHRSGLLTASLDRESSAAIAGSPHLGQLERLDLRGAGLDADAVAELVSSPRLPALRALDLYGSRATAAFARAGALPPLTQLRLGGEDVGDEVAAELTGCASLSALVQLDVTLAGIGDAGAAALACSPHLANVEELVLVGNPIGPDGACALVSSSSLGKLTRLCLDACAIGDDGAARLAALPELARLRSLSLIASQIGSLGLAALAQSPFVDGVDELAIGGFADGDPVAGPLSALVARLGKKLVVVDQRPADRGALLDDHLVG